MFTILAASSFEEERYNGLCVYVSQHAVTQSPLLAKHIDNSDPADPFRCRIETQDLRKENEKDRRCIVNLLTPAQAFSFRGKSYVWDEHHYTLQYAFKDRKAPEGEGRIRSANHYTVWYRDVSSRQRIGLHCYTDENGRYLHSTCKDDVGQFLGLSNYEKESIYAMVQPYLRFLRSLIVEKATFIQGLQQEVIALSLTVSAAKGPTQAQKDQLIAWATTIYQYDERPLAQRTNPELTGLETPWSPPEIVQAPSSLVKQATDVPNAIQKAVDVVAPTQPKKAKITKPLTFEALQVQWIELPSHKDATAILTQMTRRARTVEHFAVLADLFERYLTDELSLAYLKILHPVLQNQHDFSDLYLTFVKTLVHEVDGDRLTQRIAMAQYLYEHARSYRLVCLTRANQYSEYCEQWRATLGLLGLAFIDNKLAVFNLLREHGLSDESLQVQQKIMYDNRGDAISMAARASVTPADIASETVLDFNIREFVKIQTQIVEIKRMSRDSAWLGKYSLSGALCRSQSVNFPPDTIELFLKGMSLKVVNLLDPTLHPQDALVEKMIGIARRPAVGDVVLIPILKAYFEWLFTARPDHRPLSIKDQWWYLLSSFLFYKLMVDVVAPWQTPHSHLKLIGGATCALASMMSSHLFCQSLVATKEFKALVDLFKPSQPRVDPVARLNT